MFLGGKILMAAASVGPMIWADLYCDQLSAGYFLGLVDR
jgi:hypothetical protein